jgi:hypothetical protein
MRLQLTLLLVACAPPSAGVTFDDPDAAATALVDGEGGSSGGSGATSSPGSTSPSSASNGPSGTSNPSDPSDPSDPSLTSADTSAESSPETASSEDSTTGPPPVVNSVEWDFGTTLYAPNNPQTMVNEGFGLLGQCIAAWIETGDDVFVKTLLQLCEIEEIHLIAWNAASGGNLVDAMTGATPPPAMTYEFSGVWDRTDIAGAMLPDGDYELELEYTEHNSAAGGMWLPGPRFTIPFTLGVGEFDHQPGGDGYYFNLRAWGHE